MMTSHYPPYDTQPGEVISHAKLDVCMCNSFGRVEAHRQTDTYTQTETMALYNIDQQFPTWGIHTPGIHGTQRGGERHVH